jgi:Tfp pilus assembly protein PilO
MRFGLREIVFILFLMLIPLGAWWLVFRPQNAASDEMRKQIAIRQAKLQQLNKATATIGDLKAEIASLKEALDYFQSKLPNEKEIHRILQDVCKLAESNNLLAKSIQTINTVQESLVSPGGNEAEQPISVVLAGDYRGFYSFLLALENQSRIMRIRKMLVQTEPTSPVGSVKAEFEMSIFFEKNSEEKPWPAKNPT